MKLIKVSSGIVPIYRAVPATVSEFRHMDYVTLSKKWAIGHAEHVAAVDEEPAIVLRAFVDRSEIEDAYNPGEYRYTGSGVVGKEVYRVEAE